jgi:ATP-dependent RNA helicase HelY
MTEERRSFRLNRTDFEGAAPPRAVARIELPRSGSAGSARYRRDVAAQLANLRVRPPAGDAGRRRIDAKDQARIEELEGRIRRHPCHSCPDRAKHERWARRASKLEKDIAGLDRRIRARTETLGRQFDRVVAVLEELGYVDGLSLTPKGESLRRIYGEGDILVAESLERNALNALSPSEFAALVSTFVHESRERHPTRPEFPTAALRSRFRVLEDLWREVRQVEDRHQVQLCRELDAGFVSIVFQWAEGKPLEDVLGAASTPAGDFVRNCKQLLDLLRQIDEVASPEVAPVAREAILAVNRGVVAYTGVSPVEL